MNLRRTSLALAFLFLLAPLEAQAHRHTARAFLSGGYLDRSDLWGFATGFEKVICTKHLHDPGDVDDHCERKRFGVVGAGSFFLWGDHAGDDFNQITLMLGGRQYLAGHRKVQPVVQAFVGGIGEKPRGEAMDWSWTASIGAGMDIAISESEAWVLTVEVDLHWIDAEKDVWYPQATVGFGYRFKIRD